MEDLLPFIPETPVLKALDLDTDFSDDSI